LYYRDPINLFRPTEYHIVYEFETMEEIIGDDDEQNTYIDIENSEESSSRVVPVISPKRKLQTRSVILPYCQQHGVQKRRLERRLDTIICVM
jgi:hypothetical protein